MKSNRCWLPNQKKRIFVVVKTNQFGWFPSCAESRAWLNVNVMILGNELHFHFRSYSHHIFRQYKLNIPHLNAHSHRLKNAMKPYSQMVPRTRMQRLLDYNRRVQNSAASVDVLKEWNLELDRKLIEVDGHRLKPEVLLFGEGRTHTYVSLWLFFIVIIKPIILWLISLVSLLLGWWMVAGIVNAVEVCVFINYAIHWNAGTLYFRVWLNVRSPNSSVVPKKSDETWALK